MLATSDARPCVVPLAEPEPSRSPHGCVALACPPCKLLAMSGASSWWREVVAVVDLPTMSSRLAFAV